MTSFPLPPQGERKQAKHREAWSDPSTERLGLIGHGAILSDTKGNTCPKRFFLICRRARRQRSQSPILVTVRIDKHFGLHKRLEPKRKINEFPISLSSDGVDEQIPFDSPISKKESGNFTIQQLKRPSPMVVGISK